MRRALCWFVLSCPLCNPSILRATEPARVEVPPEPPMPQTKNLDRQQARAAFDEWRKAYDAWEAALTLEQQEYLEQRRHEERDRRERMPQAAEGYDWHAAALSQKLAPEAISRLAANKILLGRRQFKQSFEAYVDPWQPMFITSDSLLNTFHVLFEETFKELEIRRGPQLRKELETAVGNVRALLTQPPYPAEELAPGWAQAQRAIGPAMVLLGTPLDFFDAAVRADITTELAKIRAATAVDLPAWLAPSEPELVALDYRRLRPVSFYADNPGLADYFRAVRWLQMVPFRVERDHELGAIALLGFGAQRPDDVYSDGFFDGYQKLIGPADGRSITDARNIFRFRRGEKPKVHGPPLLHRKERGWCRNQRKSTTLFAPTTPAAGPGLSTCWRQPAYPTPSCFNS